MLIAKVIDNQVVQVAEHKDMFPDTSFPTTGPNDDFLSENNCLHVNLWKPYDQETEQLINCEPYIDNGQVFLVKVDKLPDSVLEDAIK